MPTFRPEPSISKPISLYARPEDESNLTIKIPKQFSLSDTFPGVMSRIHQDHVLACQQKLKRIAIELRVSYHVSQSLNNPGLLKSHRKQASRKGRSWKVSYRPPNLRIRKLANRGWQTGVSVAIKSKTD